MSEIEITKEEREALAEIYKPPVKLLTPDEFEATLEGLSHKELLELINNYAERLGHPTLKRVPSYAKGIDRIRALYAEFYKRSNGAMIWCQKEEARIPRGGCERRRKANGKACKGCEYNPRQPRERKSDRTLFIVRPDVVEVAPAPRMVKEPVIDYVRFLLASGSGLTNAEIAEAVRKHYDAEITTTRVRDLRYRYRLRGGKGA